jgi:uncharacterized protein YbaP (TraB family)
VKPRAALLVMLIALLGGASCKKTTEPVAPPPQAATPAVDPWQGAVQKKDPLPRPLLWSAEKDGVTTYLFGTMHLGVDPELRLPQRVWDELERAPSFAVETDVSDPAIARIGGRPNGGTLRDELGPDYWKKLELAITPQLAQALVHKSAMIPATMLALRGLPPTPPMDSILLARARNRGKKVVFLEPASRQAAILEKHMNARALKLMLDDLPKLEQQSQQLLAAYISGDEARFAAVADDQRRDALAHGYSEAEYDETMEDLLFRRNEAWIDPIERMHAAGSAFVAVGAMHLIGPRSVLELLARKGYKVARLAP